MTAEEKILKEFELTFLVKPKNIFDVMNLSVEEFVDVLDNFLHNEQKEAKAKVLEALQKCCGMTKEQAIHALKHMNKPKYEPNK